MPDNSNDGVGYKKPPRTNQFLPGQSGNRNGRPKGAKNFATALSKELNSTVSVNENGRRRHLSKREIIAKQLVNQAAKGDTRALPILFAETRTHDTPPPEQTQIVERPADREVMANILDRLRAADEARKTSNSITNDTNKIPTGYGTPTAARKSQVKTP